MTYEPPAQDNGATGPTAVLDDLRQIRRSSEDSVIAGVLGGVGRHFGIDPVILRVTTAVLAIFGGVGILLYALGWLLLPREDAPSLIDEARGHAAQRAPGAVPLAIGLGIVVMLSGSVVVFGSWESTVLALLAAAGLYVLLQRRGDGSSRQSPPQRPPQRPLSAPGSSWEPTRPTVDPYEPGMTLDSDSSTAATGTEPAAGGSAAQGPTPGWPEGPDWTPLPEQRPWDTGAPTAGVTASGVTISGASVSGAVPDPAVSPETTDTEPVQRRSRLRSITLAVAGLALATIAINDITWANMPPGMYAAVPLAIVGLGLLIGMRGRRTKGLIATGIVLSILLVPLTLLDRFVGPAIHESPTTLADVEDVVIDQPIGEVTYDLSAVPFADGDTANVVINQGAGELAVTLPPEVDATIRYSGGVGETVILDRHFEGFIEGQTFTDLGADGEGGGSITLNITLGLGDLEVTR